jgi:hypothetical protein
MTDENPQEIEQAVKFVDGRYFLACTTKRGTITHAYWGNPGDMRTLKVHQYEIRHRTTCPSEHILACKQSRDRELIACDSQCPLLVCLQGPNNHNQIVCDCSLTTLIHRLSGVHWFAKLRAVESLVV